MTFDSSSKSVLLRARETVTTPAPFLLKETADDDSAWNLVAQTPVTTDLPGLAQLISVTLTDGSVRVFELDDVVVIASVAHFVDGDRRELRDVADAHGWHRIDDGADLFTRANIAVEVHYRGSSAFTARRLRDRRPESYFTSEGAAKSAAVEWLTAEQTHLPRSAGTNFARNTR